MLPNTAQVSVTLLLFSVSLIPEQTLRTVNQPATVRAAVTSVTIPTVQETVILAETIITAIGAAKELQAAVHGDQAATTAHPAAAAEALVRAHHHLAAVLLHLAALVAAQPEDAVTNTGSQDDTRN